MENCKTCCHWSNRWSRRDGGGECDRPKWIDDGDTVGAVDASLYVHALDDSGLDVAMITGPLFGCVQYQEKVRR